MPFDITPSPKSLKGLANYHAGLSAEDAVVHHLEGRGLDLLERRWRGRSGEIDLIFSDGDTIVCVEVKASASFAAAAERLTARQIGRVSSAAAEYADTLPSGGLTFLRIDAALVDATGAVEVLANISMA